MCLLLESVPDLVVRETRPQSDDSQVEQVPVRLELVPAILICEKAQSLLNGGAYRDAQEEFGFARKEFEQHPGTQHYLAILERKDAYLKFRRCQRVYYEECPPESLTKPILAHFQHAALLLQEAVGKHHGDFILALYEVVDFLWWLGRKDEAKKLMAEARALAAQSTTFPLELTLEGLLGWQAASRTRKELLKSGPGSRMAA